MATVSPNMVGLSAEGADVNVGCRRERAELGVGKHGIYRRDAEEHQKQPAFRAMATVSPNMVGLSAEGAEVNVGCRRERAELGVGKHGIYRRDAEEHQKQPAISGNGYSITEYGRFERRGSRATRGLSPRKQGAGDDWDHFWSTLRQPKSTSALSARQPGVDATAAGIRHTCCVLFSSASRRLGDEKEARP